MSVYDEDLIQPVAPEDRAAFYEAMRVEQQRITRRKFVDRITKSSMLGASLAVNVGLAAAILIMLPLRRIEPMIVYQRDDGTHVNVLTWEQIPADARANTKVATLWAYTVGRESWSTGNMPSAYMIVSQLSSAPVRDQFQKSWEVASPDSPLKVYGEKATVRLDPKYYETYCSRQPCPDGYDTVKFHYDRQVIPLNEQPQKPVRMNSVVRFRHVDLPADRLLQRWTVNPAQVQVIEYSGPNSETIAR